MASRMKRSYLTMNPEYLLLVLVALSFVSTTNGQRFRIFSRKLFEKLATIHPFHPPHDLVEGQTWNPPPMELFPDDKRMIEAINEMASLKIPSKADMDAVMKESEQLKHLFPSDEFEWLQRYGEREEAKKREHERRLKKFIEQQRRLEKKHRRRTNKSIYKNKKHANATTTISPSTVESTHKIKKHANATTTISPSTVESTHKIKKHANATTTISPSTVEIQSL